VSRRHPIQTTRDAVCLQAYLDGWTTAELAETCSVSPRTMARWLRRAEANQEPPDLELWMSGAGKACPHQKPIVRGMPVLCLDCLERATTASEREAACGIPTHPALRRGANLGAATEAKNESNLHPKTLQPDGPAKFKPKIRAKKKARA
jgi:hypothetical protein